MALPRCAILDDYQHVALTSTDWSPLDGRVELDRFDRPLAPDELVDALRGHQIVVAMRERTPFPAAVFDALPELRMLVTTGMRNASIDLTAAAAHGVTVCGTRGSSTATAELTWALILGLARNLVDEANGMRAGDWQRGIGLELRGRTLGLLGLGRLGGAVAAVGQAFGMDVLAWSPHLTPERAAAGGARLAADATALFADSDVVSVHLVLSDATRGLVDERLLRAMRPTGYLVNTSRGPIVDRAALLRALRAGWLAGAGLDVYDVEPLPADDELRRLPNVLATPHVGYVTRETYATFYGDAVADVLGWLDGEPVRVLG
ncbi:D-2-hydroxyacid dehydrogenase family protein [Actinocatenispora comari]|uniref:2-hydroxyacid dehydrogenase n=1 Tax=Actinocatenispora comari TaxID=2807577 RepID=A0A8J4EPK3_9ACTN|nr:D-2-hydroxyacid dehydrogenase family protein [Actinocatenispora comari]GIL30893.1 2-hydroxyacid dehydrogenase [Actinocatenispora comari]